MLKLFVLVQVDHNLAANILSILVKETRVRNQSSVYGKPSTYHENRRFIGASISVFHSRVLSPLNFRQFNINLAGSAHTKQRTLHKFSIKVNK